MMTPYVLGPSINQTAAGGQHSTQIGHFAVDLEGRKMISFSHSDTNQEQSNIMAELPTRKGKEISFSHSDTNQEQSNIMTEFAIRQLPTDVSNTNVKQKEYDRIRYENLNKAYDELKNAIDC